MMRQNDHLYRIQTKYLRNEKLSAAKLDSKSKILEGL
jgi:hypothetical protein